MTFDLAAPIGPRWPFVVLGVTCLVYVIYHYFGRAPFLVTRIGRDLAPDDRQARAVYIQRGLGALLLGGLPGVIAVALIPGELTELGLGLERPLAAFVIDAALLALVLPVIVLQSRNARGWAYYPEIRAARWTRGRYLANGLSWAVYLLGYEFLFRGFLLFGLARWLGPWPAIAISTLAYVWAHLPKFSGETLGTIPMGVIFSATALYTGGIWAPLVAHIIIANCADVLTTRRNPALQIDW